VVNVVITVVLGTSIALLLQRLNRFFRTLTMVGLLLAWAMPALSATIVWGWLFDTQYGVINYLLSQIPGVDMIGHSWLADPVSFLGVATVIVVWGAIPFVTFTVYAGLTQVPDEVLEAAQLDGTTGFQRFRLIVAPYIRGVFVVVIVLSIIWDIRVFTQIFALQRIGGIASETSTIGVYIYSEALGGGNYGTAGAISVILILLLMAAAVVYIRQNLKEEER
jgi:N,N'-diacetylchitobiose transport system permease protein